MYVLLLQYYSCSYSFIFSHQDFSQSYDALVICSQWVEDCVVQRSYHHSIHIHMVCRNGPHGLSNWKKIEYCVAWRTQMMLLGTKRVWVMHPLKHIQNATMFVNISKSEKLCHIFVFLCTYLKNVHKQRTLNF